MRKHPNNRRLVVALAITAAAVAVVYAASSSSPRDAADDLRRARATKRDMVSTTTAIGVVKPMVGAEVRVGSRLSGVVAELNVNIGDEVAKGDALASLDDAEWRARVATLAAELTEAQAELDYARSELTRLTQLEDNVASIDVERAERNLKVREAAVERARARFREAEIQLSYTRITAPVAGTIASVSTYEGETVAASFAAPTFVTIIDLKRLEIQAYVDETDVGRAQVGQPVTFRVDAYPGRDLDGVVHAIYPKAELVNNVVNYIAIIAIADREGLLIRPEMTAHVSFVLDERRGVVAIPRSALLRESGRSFAIAEVAGAWVKTPIETGLTTPQHIEVVAGLEDGAIVIADAQRWLEMAAENEE